MDINTDRPDIKNVYFSGAFFNCEDDEKCGIEQAVNITFVSNGRNYYIPSIYTFDEGIVVDLLYEIEPDEIINYYETVEALPESVRFIDMESPFNIEFDFEISLNGNELISDYSYTALSYNPFDELEPDDTEPAIEYVKRYSFDTAKGWEIRRYVFEWGIKPEDDIKTVGICLNYDKIAKPIFEFSSNDKEIEFVNPENKQNYTFCVVDSVRETLPNRFFKKLNMKKNTIAEQVWCRIIPQLSDEDYYIQQIDRPEDIFDSNGNTVGVYFDFDSERYCEDDMIKTLGVTNKENPLIKWEVCVYQTEYEDFETEFKL